MAKAVIATQSKALKSDLTYEESLLLLLQLVLLIDLIADVTHWNIFLTFFNHLPPPPRSPVWKGGPARDREHISELNDLASVGAVLINQDKEEKLKAQILRKNQKWLFLSFFEKMFKKIKLLEE